MYKTLIVVDNDSLLLGENLADVVSFDTYLAEYPKHNEPKTRIINLCDTEQYLSKGYYCSLLAEARNHKVLPSVKTINEISQLKKEADSLLAYRSYLPSTYLTDQQSLQLICFGQVEDEQLKPLAKQLFNKFASPLLMLEIQQVEGEVNLQLKQSSLVELNPEQKQQFIQQLQNFTHQVWRVGTQRKRHRWDMAILIDPNEKVPPSNKEAISRFVKAASKNGIHADVLSIGQIQNIAYYDALFIRETTAIDHHTYNLACKAESNDLVVIDDPTSILRCCNKVFLHDAFSYKNVPSLKTQVVASDNEASLNLLEQGFSYPLVLKMPEGSFSKGVFKVDNRKQLQDKLKELLKHSALVLAQEFLYTDFDWRIGVLNGRAIYACRYEMARNHWQIYNHDAKRFFSGGFETLPTFEVPKSVLDAALKAARIIGDGLYGVDVKEADNKSYVLEVNDNPSIEHKVEDAYLGDELYMQIMAEFQQRLEARGR